MQEQKKTLEHHGVDPNKLEKEKEKDLIRYLLLPIHSVQKTNQYDFESSKKNKLGRPIFARSSTLFNLRVGFCFTTRKLRQSSF